MITDFKDPVTHATIEKIAAAYDRLADAQEKVATEEEAAGMC